MTENYTYLAVERVLVPVQRWAELRADLARTIVALRRVLDGMTVQELAALTDLVDELTDRYGEPGEGAQ